MKSPDLDRMRCEQRLSLKEFLSSYNEGLPEQFPRASSRSLQAFSLAYPDSFRAGSWSLDQHRKKVMDWLPGYVRSNPDRA